MATASAHNTPILTRTIMTMLLVSRPMEKGKKNNLTSSVNLSKNAADVELRLFFFSVFVIKPGFGAKFPLTSKRGLAKSGK